MCLQNAGNHLSTDAVALPSGRGYSVVIVATIIIIIIKVKIPNKGLGKP
jgi:hypothetical protein